MLIHLPGAIDQIVHLAHDSPIARADRSDAYRPALGAGLNPRQNAGRLVSQCAALAPKKGDGGN